MRRFLTFFGSGVLIISVVFVYAQLTNKTVVIDWHGQPDRVSSDSQVKGAKDVVKKSTKQASPIKIFIDKNPVLLYYPQKITIQTTPNTEVRVKVTYPNGSVNNSGTKTGTSDKNGKYVVSWNIKGNAKTMLGTSQVEVSVGSLATFSEASSSFEIVKTLPKNSSSIKTLPALPSQALPKTVPSQTSPSVNYSL